MSIFVGAYPLLADRRDAETPVLAALAASPDVRGLEIPWAGSLGGHDAAGLLARTPARWRSLITCIPGTVARLEADPSFGLASDDPSGAAAAVTELAVVRDAVAELHDLAGERVITGVEVHSAPRRTSGSSSASLARSLSQAMTWDWDGAELLLEHVDAEVGGRSPSKGFLPLDDELRALADSGVGVVINWARSAIETRDAGGPDEHIALARRAGLLRGVMFSGVSSEATDYGPAWVDAHLPSQDAEPASLLTLRAIGSAIDAAGPDVFLGAKMSWSGSVDGAIAMVLAAAEQIAHARTAVAR